MGVPLSLEQVRSMIEKVFPAIPLDPSDAFSDWGWTYLDGDGFERESRGRTWKELTTRFLFFYSDALGFLGPQAFVDYLPAFLVATVEFSPDVDTMPRSLLMSLCRESEDAHFAKRFDAQTRLLTPGQRLVIAHALALLEQGPDDRCEPDLAKAALNSHWRNELVGS